MRELRNDELVEIDGGGIFGGIVSIILGTAAASIAVVSAISVPFGTGLAGAGAAAGAGLVAKACFEEAMSEFSE